jgi:hypothetical protein
MTPQDHNKTLVIIFSLFSALWTLVLLASPWIVAQTFRHQEQIPTAVLLFGFVFLMALLFWSTAIAMHRRKPLGRKLALISAVALLMFWPLTAYIWWFMHSEGAKEMYGVKQYSEQPLLSKPLWLN